MDLDPIWNNLTLIVLPPPTKTNASFLHNQMAVDVEHIKCE